MQGTGKDRDTKDQYYTKRAVAETCVKDILESLPWTSTALWIEPSAGAGAFLGIYGGETIALDLEPKAVDVIAGDFLQWSNPLTTDKQILFFGNPPFGRQGSIAKKFLRHACKQGANALAFILPRSFMKPSMYGCIPLTYHLVKQCDLSKDSFEVNRQSYNVPCIFQIWEKRAKQREVVEKEKADGFVYVKPGETYDLAFRRVGGDAGKSFQRGEIENPSAQSHHFLKFDDGINVIYIQKRVNTHIFPSNTTGPRSLSKPEINVAINTFIYLSLDGEFADLI